MLSLPPTVRIFLAPGATDIRKQFADLAGLTTTVIGEDPLSSHLFVFCNGGRNRLKTLYFDSTGHWLFAKRLEKGTFAWPRPPDVTTRGSEMTHAELALILGAAVSAFLGRGGGRSMRPITGSAAARARCRNAV